MTLCDTGPMVALANSGDKDHGRCAVALNRLSKPFVTTWPCLTEAMYLLRQFTGLKGQDKLWRLLDSGAILVHETNFQELNRMKILMSQYQDAPMDFADASLVSAAERLHILRIFTLDSHFYIYRISDRDTLEVVP